MLLWSEMLFDVSNHRFNIYGGAFSDINNPDSQYDGIRYFIYSFLNYIAPFSSHAFGFRHSLFWRRGIEMTLGPKDIMCAEDATEAE